MATPFLHRITLLVAVVLLAIPVNGATKKKKTPSKPARQPSSAPKQRPDSSDPDGDGPATSAGPLKLGPNGVPDIPPGDLPIVSDGAVLLDGYTGRVLYEKNPDQALYPASTTKIMTALLVIEAGNLDQEMEVTLEDSKVGESSLDIKPGERFTRRQALYGLMLKSANDVAHLLGRDNAGSIEAFAAKMTKRAAELGATNTSFANPNGLHHLQHYTTARDLALITRAAMQQPAFRQIVGTVTFPWTSPSTGPRELWNHNRMLRNFPGCTGVKTGYTNPAQHTLATAALWGTREMICVVMHSTKLGKWDDSKLLLTYGFSAVNSPGQSGSPATTTAVR